MIAEALRLAVSGPKFIVPRQRRLTLRPVRPSRVVFMAPAHNAGRLRRLTPEPAASSARLGHEQHLADVAPPLDVAVRLRRALEREHPIDARPDGAPAMELEERGELLAEQLRLAPQVPHVDAPHRPVVVHEADGRVERHPRQLAPRAQHAAVLTGGEVREAVSHQPAGRTQQPVTLPPVLPSQGIEHDVDAPAAGEGLHLRLVIAGPVVDGMVTALAPEHLVLRGRRGAERLDARHGPAELEHGEPHATRRHVDENLLARSKRRHPEERVVGGEIVDRQRGPLLEGHRVRHGHRLPGRQAKHVGLAAEARHGEDARAHRRGGHAGPECVDHAGHLVTHHGG